MMMLSKRPSGLGRGLGALIPPKQPVSQPFTDEQELSSGVSGQSSVISDQTDVIESVRRIPVELISPNPHQPREHFDYAALEDLVSSIKEHGILQPLVVSPLPNGRYELIAGERRLRAAKIAELPDVPAIVRTVTEQQKLELAIIENVQRQNLNPIEEARAYIRLRDEFDLTQDEIGERVGKSRPQVGNIIRLLQLEPEVQSALAQEKISASNARTLLSIPEREERLALFQRMLEGNFTVRQAEEHIPKERRRFKIIDPNLLDIESRLRSFFGLRVAVKRQPNGHGEVKIAFENDEDLNNIINRVSATGEVEL
ncbi:MAG: ParB/RepB/Spo0J family partition protein [Patescibacteria group bacterium]|jgi:ParB family chromosome partitioning protein